MQVPHLVQPLPVVMLQHPLFQIHPAWVHSKEKAVLLKVFSPPWVLALGSFLLQEKGQLKWLVVEGPQGSPRLLLEWGQLVQKPLMEKQEMHSSLHPLPCLQRGLHYLGGQARLLMKQAFLELLELVVA